MRDALYEANRRDVPVWHRLQARAARKTSAVTFQRSRLTRDADLLGEHIGQRTARAEQLRGEQQQLKARAHELRREVRADIAANFGLRGGLASRVAELRAELPAYARQQDAADRARHQGLREQAAEQRAAADGHRQKAAGLRSEAALRGTLSPECATTESTERTAVARQAAERRRAAQERAAATARQHQRRYEPPRCGRPGPSLGR
jgi:hypothetical protein